ncbi:hypothetical protein C9F11_46710 (plasmid) [Streptomyces sp. YIM 121038]|uniref:hypothetical protein n=1 Tax=Streptomyces sp. YIM 121038 TaxID=2136401 RepID=UPI0011101FD3|nr:hypothetical protein [Streptomyces sp. YIM 121038]QCX82889.1 hypothetical protein C9F11_46710 [Streptomyces sp. YIM 121038]
MDDFSQPLLLTVGALRRLLDAHGVEDRVPIAIHADILGGTYTASLRFESATLVGQTPPHLLSDSGGRPHDHGHITRVILNAGPGYGPSPHPKAPTPRD